MPGLVPGIHDLLPGLQDADARTKSGHDEGKSQRSAARFGEGAGCPFPVTRLRQRLRRALPDGRDGAPGGARGLRGPLTAPCDRGGFAHRRTGSRGVTAGPSGCRNGVAKPIPGRARPATGVCEARRPDAAPPGAPPPTGQKARSAVAALSGPVSATSRCPVTRYRPAPNGSGLPHPPRWRRPVLRPSAFRPASPPGAS